VEDRPVGREETLRLARAAQEVFVKAGTEIRRFHSDERPMTDSEMLAYLVHEDGWMRVPVLVDGPLLVRGYTEALYSQALGRGAP
jgi:arsenate reductase-like glutaredoxin family protein